MPEKTYTIRGIEIFATGEHKGIQFTQGHIETMAADTMKVLSEVQPFLRIGHPPKDGTKKNIGDELSISKRSDQPALGWLDNIRVMGSKILCDAKKVPGLVKEAIEKGSYRRVSAEVEQGYESATGQRLPLVIKAVALLGAKTPEIKTLKPIVALDEGQRGTYALEDVPLGDLQTEEEKAMADEKKVEEGKNKEQTMSVDEVVGKIEELTKAVSDIEEFLSNEEPGEGDKDKAQEQLVTLKDSISALQTQVKDLEAGNKTLKEQADAEKKARKSQEVKTTVDELIRSTKVPPAVKDEMVRLMEELPEEKLIEFGEGDKKVTKSPVEVIVEMLRKFPKITTFDEMAAGGESKTALEFEEEFEKNKDIFEKLEVSKEDWKKHGPHAEFFAEQEETGGDKLSQLLEIARALSQK